MKKETTKKSRVANKSETTGSKKDLVMAMRGVREQATRHKRGTALRQYLMEDLLIIEEIVNRVLG